MVLTPGTNAHRLAVKDKEVLVKYSIEQKAILGLLIRQWLRVEYTVNSNEEEIEMKIKKIVGDIIVPLRAKEVNESAFEELFLFLEQLIVYVKQKDSISRQIAGHLFLLYTQIETQLNYALKHQEEPIKKKKIRLTTYLREVFGDVLEN